MPWFAKEPGPEPGRDCVLANLIVTEPRRIFLYNWVCGLPRGFMCESSLRGVETAAEVQWFRSAKNRVVNTGPLACPFARSLAPLTHSLAPPCLLCSRAPLCSFVCSLAHFTHSQAVEKVRILMSHNRIFYSS